MSKIYKPLIKMGEIGEKYLVKPLAESIPSLAKDIGRATREVAKIANSSIGRFDVKQLADPKNKRRAYLMKKLREALK